MLARVGLALPFALALVAAHVSTASAQVPPPPPPTGDPIGDAPGGYPLALVDRPLMLPSGMAEVEGRFTIPTSEGISLFDLVYMDLVGRYSTGSFEPFAGLQFLLIQPEGSEGSALQRLYAGARAPVGPGYGRVTASRFAPVDGISNLTLDGRFEYKQKLGPKIAAVAEGGLAASFVSVDLGGMGTASGNVFYLVASGAGQVQLAPMAAIQGGIALDLPLATGGDITDADTVTNLFGDVLYAMPKFDIFARLAITIAGDADQTSFIVGVLARPM